MSLCKELDGVRAVICDVYGTLLKVGPPPGDAERLWESGCRVLAGEWMPLEEFNARTAAMIAAENAQRRLDGETFPDVNWLVLMRRIFGRRLEAEHPSRAKDLCDLHARCVRTCTAMPDAVVLLESLHARGVRLGLASNAQDYTRGELRAAGIPVDLFDSPLIIFSGEQGSAKPSPRVFAHLTGKLGAIGIGPHETLMIGDSLVNDIAPAAAAGWRTWHIGPRTWAELLL